MLIKMEYYDKPIPLRPTRCARAFYVVKQNIYL